MKYRYSSDKLKLLKQDLLIYEGGIQIAKKIPVVQLSHKRAMINFRFEGLVRDDISEPTVRVSVDGVDYTPYNVRATGTLEYMLILSENTPGSSILGQLLFLYYSGSRIN